MITIDGRALKEARKDKGFSQLRLAQETGLSQSKISRAEQTGDLPEEDLHLIVDALEAHYLLFEICDACKANNDIAYKKTFPEYNLSNTSAADTLQGIMLDILNEIGPLRRRIDSLKPASAMYKSDLNTWKKKINQLHALATILKNSK